MTGSDHPSNSQVDLRGFRYSLEPLERKRQWELDALLGRLSRIQKQISDAQTKRGQLQAMFRLQSAKAAEAVQERVDPGTHRRMLAYLTQLGERIREAEEELAQLREKRDELQAQCVAQQQKIELLARHREDSVRDYAVDMGRRQGAESDSDWIARRHWRTAQDSGGEVK